jgi:hypothetical protein
VLDTTNAGRSERRLTIGSEALKGDVESSCNCAAGCELETSVNGVEFGASKLGRKSWMTRSSG